MTVDTTHAQPAAVDAAHHVHPHDREPIVMWVIYVRPADMPGVDYVARRWEIQQGVPAPVATDTIRHGTLIQLREHFFSQGLYRLARYEADDPAIVECWL